ncbi:hypothetical protein [Anaerosporobacter sp.]|uniref:hypothetical protein n=1 Tax=Anaerosporobacter sp. TaxID=1872529 RepID=UPI00286EECB9|nr:hypothetical protein [Anaerosporobacter sp.]
MEQCLAFKTYNMMDTATLNMAAHILYTKESTHSAYQQHHRYILHHKITYHSQCSSSTLQSISGELYQIDDLGERLPCSYIPITVLSSDNASFQTSLTDAHGNYDFSYPIDYSAAALLNRVRYSANLKLFAYLPSIRIHFPLDTTIDDWDNILVETPYVIK